MGRYKIFDKAKTVQNILDKANRSIGTSINIEKFNKRANDISFLKEVAEFLGVEVAYK